MSFYQRIADVQAPTPLRLLVVDDDDVDREQTLRLLGRSGLDAHVTEAPDATSALALCKRNSFDCVLLDYHLPDMEQLDLVEKINDGTTAVLVLTGAPCMPTLKRPLASTRSISPMICNACSSATRCTATRSVRSHSTWRTARSSSDWARSS